MKKDVLTVAIRIEKKAVEELDEEQFWVAFNEQIEALKADTRIGIREKSWKFKNEH